MRHLFTQIILGALMMVPVAANAQYHDYNNCSGKQACTMCLGQGVVTMGYNYMRCQYCGGTGVIPCGMCAAYKMGQEAGRRARQSSSSSSSGVYYNGGTGSGTTSTKRSSTRRTCPGCNGSGKGADQITYAPDYTGNAPNVYCSTCGRTTSRHSHHRPVCRVCNGRTVVD